MVVAAALALLGGCSPDSNAPTSTPTTASTPTATATPSVSESPSVAATDFTEPGVARAMVSELLAAAGSPMAVMVAISQHEVRVAVESEGTTETWAYRDGQIGTVQSDIVNVDQAAFLPQSFAISDVGALFRSARAVSGSDANQELQIVDYSGGIVAMTVTTTPESRTVFFTPAGTIVPTLDLTTETGVHTAFTEARGIRGQASQVVFSTSDGVYLDTNDPASGTITRYHRSPRTPVLVTSRSETSSLKPFDPQVIDPAIVWDVIAQARRQGRYSFAEEWICVVDDREGSGQPKLYFQVGTSSFTTTLAGARVSE